MGCGCGKKRKSPSEVVASARLRREKAAQQGPTDWAGRPKKPQPKPAGG